MAKKFLLFSAILIILTSCVNQAKQTDITVTIYADGSNTQLSVAPGSTVQQAVAAAGLTLSQSDRVAPALYSVVTDGGSITVTRVREEFETQQVIIPYERQELHNESLPTGDTRLIQAGQNGLREVTIRHIFENGAETGNSVVSETILQAATPEIIMIGVQSPFAPLSIPGKLAYLKDGNAWVTEGTTSNPYPLVTTGDLDSHIFSLSPDGKWLLFTRKSKQAADKEINTLWAVSTSQPPMLVNLGISNVVHFAAWQPGKKYIIAYSTVEPRATAPGWQANNDLHYLTFQNSTPGRTNDVLETNSGGIYGWWGMSFFWSPDGQTLAYSRPDGAGLIDIQEGVGTLSQIINITPLNTHSDWAWTPGLTWGADSQSLYLVVHAAPSGLVSADESTNFDLAEISLTDKVGNTIIPQTGMFAYPAASSLREVDSTTSFLLAYLQAIFPTQSGTSRYQLNIMNSDGTNIRSIFPSKGQTGLEPQIPVWAPYPMDTGADYIAVVYEGNLWIVDATTGLSQQITGDGLTSEVDWK
jgi:hypothetical protein